MSLVIFDCDGVLIDSEPIACRIEAELLTRAGFPIDAETVIRRFAGKSARDMAAAIEETFGPAAAILRVGDADEAIALANATEFGLAAALWTGDLGRARRLVRQIEAGAVFVNGQVVSDARLPFGGIKQSGYGRELGAAGAREFTNTKTVWIGPAR